MARQSETELAPLPRGPARAEPAFDLGKALIEDQLITEVQLARAQRVISKLKRPRSLESVLSELGFLFRRDLETVYARRKRRPPLGVILIERAATTPEKVDAALGAQAKGDKRRLGEILLADGLDPHQLLAGLADQSGYPLVTADLAAADRSLFGKLPLAFLKRKCALPFSRVDRGVVVLLPEPPDVETSSDLEKVLERRVFPGLAPREDILAALRQIEEGYFDRPRPIAMPVAQAELPPLAVVSSSLPPMVESAPAPRMAAPPRQVEMRPSDSRLGESMDGSSFDVVGIIDSILQRAVAAGASDVHVEPLAKGIRVRQRVDGELETLMELPANLAQFFAGRIKVMAECDVAEHRRNQDGRFGFLAPEGEIDVRVSVFPSIHGESIVMRLLARRKGALRVEELGMPPVTRDRFREEVLRGPAGIVIVVGPTGAGKTSTLYSAISFSNKPNTKIITLEDPVEYEVDGIIQCQIHTKIGQSFAESLRAVVRHDPEIVVLGEIRDAESAEAATQLALTGHRVFATLHAEDSLGGLVRLERFGIDRFVLASTLTAVLAQRLVRKVCAECAETVEPTAQELKYFGLDESDLAGHTLLKGKGCPSCRQSGYRGRTGIYELLIPDARAKERLTAGVPSAELRQAAVEHSGLFTLQEVGLAQVLRGLTTLDEIRDNIVAHPKVRPMKQVLQGLGYEKGLSK